MNRGSVSRAPPHHILPAFLNLSGKKFFIQEIFILSQSLDSQLYRTIQNFFILLKVILKYYPRASLL